MSLPIFSAGGPNMDCPVKVDVPETSAFLSQGVTAIVRPKVETVGVFYINA